MARPRKETDLKGQMLKRYAHLVEERNYIEGELRGLEAFLKAVGEIRPSRGRRNAGKGPQSKKTASRGAKKVSATESILSCITKAEKGVSIDQIMKETGFGRMTVYGVLNRMKSEKKVKAAKRGIYVKVNSGQQRSQVRKGKKSQAVLSNAAVPQKETSAEAKTQAKQAKRIKKVTATEPVSQKSA